MSRTISRRMASGLLSSVIRLPESMGMASRPWIRSCSGWAFSPPRSSAGEEPGQLADPDGVRAVHGLRPLGAAPAEADFAKQHVEADPGKRDGIDEGEPGQRDPDGAPLHHHPKGDPATITV